MEFLKIKQLIQEDDLGTALEQLQAVIKEPELSNELIITIANYHALQSDIRKAIIEFEKATIEENRIRNTVLEIIDAAENGKALRGGKRPKRAYKKTSTTKQRLAVAGILVLGFLYVLGSVEELPEEPVDNTAALGLMDMMNEMDPEFDAAFANASAMQFTIREFAEEKPLNDNPALGRAVFSFTFEEPVNYPDQDVLERVRRLMYEDILETDYQPGGFESNVQLLKGAHFRLSDYLHQDDPAIEIRHEEIKRYKASVFYANQSVLTMRVKMIEQFSGKAPTIYNRYHSYDLINGERITYEDIFQPLSDRGLSRKLTARLIEMSGASSSEELQSLGFWDTQIVPTHNIYFNDNGVCFIFQPYELTPEESKENTVCFTSEELDIFFNKPFPYPELLK
ncbi:MAG: DUF3298 domain-containing protein [Bacteroidota bacterium]